MTEPANDRRQEREKQYRLMRRFARESAVQLLYQLDLNDDWEAGDTVYEEFWQQIDELIGMPVDIKVADIHDLAARLVAGVVAEREGIDEHLSALAAHWRLDRMSLVDRNILRLAAYEIIHREDIPPLASVNEAIEMAKAFGDRDSRRFVNGILDRLLHDREELK